MTGCPGPSAGTLATRRGTSTVRSYISRFCCCQRVLAASSSIRAWCPLTQPAWYSTHAPASSRLRCRVRNPPSREGTPAPKRLCWPRSTTRKRSAFARGWSPRRSLRGQHDDRAVQRVRDVELRGLLVQGEVRRRLVADAVDQHLDLLAVGADPPHGAVLEA